MAFHMPEHRMPDGGLAELARQRDMLRVIEMLVAEKHDLPFQESGANLFQLLGRQRPFEIDAADFRADMERQRHDLDRSVRPGACALLR